ncbi:MAG: glycosyltransferase family 4 protein [Bryobacteraceae bacterium]|nr:glycosyltransferase family 4 protein [Bryobacteraceae bacterium]
MLQVLITSIEYPPFVKHGGLGTHTRCLSEGLAQLGHRVLVLTAHHGDAKIFEAGGVTVVLRDMREYSEIGKASAAVLRDLAEAAVLTTPAVLKGLGFRPDVVHSQASHLLTAAKELSELYRCGLTATVHICHKHMAQLTGGEIHPEFALQERLLYELPCRLFVVSEGLRQVLLNYYGQRSDVEVIWNGLDVAQAARVEAGLRRDRLRARIAGEGTKAVALIGHLTMEKGLPAVLESARALCQSGMPVKYWLIGDMPGRARDYYEDFVSGDACLASRIRWFRKVSRTSALKFAALADVVVLPSIFDSCPYVALEAMAVGTPVIASDTGGLPEIVDHGRTGLLVGVGNQKEFVARQRELLLDDSLRGSMGVLGRERVATHFTQRLMAEKYARNFREIT